MKLDTPITYLKGVGPQRAKIFQSKAVFTVEDLLYYLPFRYEDRGNTKRIADLAPGETATVIGEVSAPRMFHSHRGSARLVEIRVRDGSGQPLVCKWFRGEYLRSVFESGQQVAFYGKVEWNDFSREVSMFHPQYEILEAAPEAAETRDPAEARLHTGRVVPVYQAIGRLNTRVIRGLVRRALDTVEWEDDPLPESVRRRVGLPGRADAVRDAHFPPPDTDLRLLEAFRTPAQARLIFEEFFFLECGLALKRRKARRQEGIQFELNDQAREKIKSVLPFKPTAAQKRVLGEIARDMSSNAPMNRLLQGDVGSGKTIVAVEAAVIALENGYQVAIMAPTEILAAQHYFYFRNLLEPAGYSVVMLTGSGRAREKAKRKRLIAEGEARVVVGTQALISKDVAFHDLGLIVVDEQHRFGVMQRFGLLAKGKHPDVLVMTATPIPRTLALTVYGDLDVSIIDELPPGRRPIVTKHAGEEVTDKVYGFLRKQVEKGRQVYVVCPLIEESDTKAVKAASRLYEHLAETIFPDLEVALLHGRLKGPEKESVMEDFKKGRVQILVATTVIEVGVDVPNATVMLIEHAETFGLAQLHQLRGRVGRGAEKSYCVLLTGEMNETAAERIRTMVETQDGFRIAETDLQLRGPGEFFGTKQSGLPAFRVANLVRDRDLLENARGEAGAFIENPEKADEVQALVRYIQGKWQRRYGLVKVG